MNNALNDTTKTLNPWFIDVIPTASGITLEYDAYDDEKLATGLDLLDKFLKGHHLTMTGSIEAFGGSIRESFGWIYEHTDHVIEADEDRLSIFNADTDTPIAELMLWGCKVSAV